MVKVGLDLMGGEKGIDANMYGALQAIDKIPDLHMVLYGITQEIIDILHRYQKGHLIGKRIEISGPKNRDSLAAIPKNATEEDIIKARKRFPEASVVKMIGDIGTVTDVGISSADTRALVSLGSSSLGRIRYQENGKNIAFPTSLATFIPKIHGGKTLMLDLGGQLQSNYYANALLGYAFLRSMGIEFPTIALLNIGTEADKGTPELKQAYKDIGNFFGDAFLGNVEPNHLLNTSADMVVTDAMSGNIALKSMEGTAKNLGSVIKKQMLSSIMTKFGSLFNGKAISQVKQQFNPSQYGGAVFLGLEGLLIKSHGNSDEQAIQAAILKAYHLAKIRIIENVKFELLEMRMHVV